GALRAVALLELLAGAAPAGIVPPDVLDGRVDLRARGNGCRDRAAARRRERRRAGREHRLGARERLVLVAERALAVAGLLLLELLRRGGLVGGHLGVEEERH